MGEAILARASSSGGGSKGGGGYYESATASQGSYLAYGASQTFTFTLWNFYEYTHHEFRGAFCTMNITNFSGCLTNSVCVLFKNLDEPVSVTCATSKGVAEFEFTLTRTEQTDSQIKFTLTATNLYNSGVSVKITPTLYHYFDYTSDVFD